MMPKWTSPASKLQAEARRERLERIQTLLRELKLEIYKLNDFNLADDEQRINEVQKVLEGISHNKEENDGV